MICPDCAHDNISGSDVCEGCGQDLTALDTPGCRSELEKSIMEAPLERLSTRTPVLLPPDASVAEAVARLCEPLVSAVLIGTPDNLQGIFSERDVLLRVADRYERIRDNPVSEFMTLAPETLDMQDPIACALNKMEVGDFRHLVVTRDGVLAGLISLRDVVEFLSGWYPDLIPARD